MAAAGFETCNAQLAPDSVPTPTPIVMPVTGVEPATVVRLLTVMLRSVVPDALIVNVLKSLPWG